MSYKVNHTDTANHGSVTVDDKTLNYDTSIPLVGRYYPGYAKYVAQSLVSIMENFASFVEPTNPSTGQLWYNTDSNSAIPEPKLLIWDGSTWMPAGNITKSTNAPAAMIGDLWVDTDNLSLNLWNGSDWVTFSTEYDHSTGTRLKIETLTGTDDVGYSVVVIYIGNQSLMTERILMVVSNDEFSPNPSIDGIPMIYPGINIPSSTTFNGMSTDSKKLEGLPKSSFFIKNEPNETNSIHVKSSNGFTVSNSTGSKMVVIKPDSTSMVLTSKNDIKLESNNESSAATTIVLRSDNIVINKNLDTVNDINCKQVNATIANSSIANINNLTITNKIELENGASIYPKPGAPGTLGTSNNYWGAIYVNSVNSTSIGVSNSQINGNLNGTVNGKQLLYKDTIFKTTGDVLSPNISSVSGIVNIETTLSPTLLSGKTPVSNVTNSDHILIERNNVLESIDLHAVSVPIGTIILHPGLPTGYVICDGRSLDKIEYNMLFEVIGDLYGDSANTFNVPDLSSIVIGVGIRYIIFTGKW